MSETIVLQNFVVEYDDRAVAERLRVKPGSRAEQRLAALLDTARTLAEPKAVFRSLKPEVAEGKTVLESVEFKSELLSRHLAEAGLAFPYVATCGRELDDWARSLGGLEQFMANEIMILTLRQAVTQLEQLLKDKFELPEVSAMNPGSLAGEWPIVEQRPLFELMGEFPSRIGVELMPSLLMNPGKSVSGIYFKTVEKFHNCQLCTKPMCPSRKAPFQGDAMEMMA